MKKGFAAALGMPVLLLLAGCNQGVISVMTVEELIEAVGPDRTIELQPGHYDLSKAPRRDHAHVKWSSDSAHNVLTVQNVRNLRIRGAGRNRVRVTVTPEDGVVLPFVRAVSPPWEGHLPLGNPNRLRGPEDVKVSQASRRSSEVSGPFDLNRLQPSPVRCCEREPRQTTKGFANNRGLAQGCQYASSGKAGPQQSGGYGRTSTRK